jgi:hypothetical protein
VKKIVSSIISSVFKEESNLQSKTTALRPGQVFNGKILKLFPNQTAEVQIGNQRMIAQLDIPLQVDNRYWLQVQPGEGKIHLKVFRENLVSSGSQEGLETVLKAFGISSSKENIEIVQFFLKEQLPVSKELIQNSATWIKDSGQSLIGLNTMKWMINQGYPITKDTFQSLLSMQAHEPITEIMSKAWSELDKATLKTPVSNSLKELLSTFITSDGNHVIESLLEDSDLFHPTLKKLIESIGLQYERNYFDNLKGLDSELVKQDNLKGLLLQYLAEHPNNSNKEPAEQLLHRITGMQLLSKDMGPIQQVIMQIPIPFWNNNTEVTLQWSGRKTEDGKIDPNFCRVLFYLDLENLKETVVDLHIQNRILSIKIINEHHQLMKDFKPFEFILKENLKKINYHLSSVLFEHPQKQSFDKRSQSVVPKAYQNQSYTGVDIKV